MIARHIAEMVPTTTDRLLLVYLGQHGPQTVVSMSAARVDKRPLAHPAYIAKRLPQLVEWGYLSAEDKPKEHFVGGRSAVIYTRTAKPLPEVSECRIYRGRQSKIGPALADKPEVHHAPPQELPDCSMAGLVAQMRKV
jgi:hypothetical protein